MRPLILIAPLLASGCALFTGQPEGNWLLTLTETASVCDGVPADDLDEPTQGLGTTYRLNDGTFVLETGGVMLLGDASREGFNLSQRDETRLTDGTDCTLYSEGTNVTLRGSWGDDLMLQGNGSSEFWERAEACYGITNESVCTYEFRLEGILLNSTSQDHVVDGITGSSIFSGLGGGGGGYF
ncbi:MAG: hypothetical protein H6740_21120 [Alphaproteobacteria bacterium]|nr:hypothetical protein [Alphaproteobacteria bacterium]